VSRLIGYGSPDITLFPRRFHGPFRGNRFIKKGAWLLHSLHAEGRGRLNLWLMAFAVTLAPGFAAQLPNQLIVAKKNEVLVHVGYVDVCAAPASN